jgi:hypothetical protein
MTNKELQFALDKALEIAKEKDREIQRLKDKMEGLNPPPWQQPHLINYDALYSNNLEPNYKIGIIIGGALGIASGFILALILL